MKLLSHPRSPLLIPDPEDAPELSPIRFDLLQCSPRIFPVSTACTSSSEPLLLPTQALLATAILSTINTCLLNFLFCFLSCNDPSLLASASLPYSRWLQHHTCSAALDKTINSLFLILKHGLMHRQEWELANWVLYCSIAPDLSYSILLLLRIVSECDRLYCWEKKRQGKHETT